MLKTEKTRVYGWEEAIRGMRNPRNSWDRSDSYYTRIEDPDTLEAAPYEYFIGEADHELMMKLARSGSDHRKFMRMITVYVDITAPLYWWKEYDTYKVGTVANSCSTMNKLCEKEITLDDFSWDRIDLGNAFGDGFEFEFSDVIGAYVADCELLRSAFVETGDQKYWRALIQLLPESYNQRRTIMLNYEVLRNVYRARRSHKLSEWRTLCEWIEGLPYSEVITGKE